MGHNTCEVGYWPVGNNVCFKLQYVVGALSAVAEHKGVGTGGKDQPHSLLQPFLEICFLPLQSWRCSQGRVASTGKR